MKSPVNRTATLASATPEPRQRKPEVVRARIIEVAQQAFAERGFEGATLELIASRARSSTQLIIYHFKSKLGLWRAAVEEISGATEQGLAAIIGNPDLSAAERLRRVIDFRIRALANTPFIHRMIVIDAYVDSERLAWLVKRYVKNYHESLVALIEKAQHEGAVRDLDPVRIRYAILGVAALPTVAAEFRALTRRNATDPAEIEASIAFVIKLIFNEGALGSIGPVSPAAR